MRFPCQAVDKTHDQQFAEVMTGIPGPRIGDIIEGGEKGFHVGFKLQRGVCPSRIHPSDNCKACQISSNPICDSPALAGEGNMEIKWRGKKLSLYRRVPKRYETIETRRFVWLSLDTDSMTEAERKEGPTWEQFVAGWKQSPQATPLWWAPR